MAGHSKWHNIKHKKMAQDQKRGKIFTKVLREIFVAVKQGGANPDNNPRLRLAIEMAKEAKMPKENIERAIKKASGELSGESMEEVFFEGYGPGGVALYIAAITDNRNRTASQIRALLTKYGGSLAEVGAVSWIFDRMGIISLSKQDLAGAKDEIVDFAIENGAQDINEDDETLNIYCDPKDFENLKNALSGKGFKWERAEITFVPKSTVKVSGKGAEALLKLMDALDDNDDVQKVWANFEIDDSEFERIMATA